MKKVTRYFVKNNCKKKHQDLEIFDVVSCNCFSKLTDRRTKELKNHFEVVLFLFCIRIHVPFESYNLIRSCNHFGYFFYQISVSILSGFIEIGWHLQNLLSTNITFRCWRKDSCPTSFLF